MPWALTHDDTLPSGLALTPTLHRAFDRKLLWIDEEYRVRLAAGFGELAGQAHGIRQFEGKRLQLPPEPAWWPGQENLRAQRVYNYSGFMNSSSVNCSTAYSGG